MLAYSMKLQVSFFYKIIDTPKHQLNWKQENLVCVNQGCLSHHFHYIMNFFIISIVTYRKYTCVSISIWTLTNAHWANTICEQFFVWYFGYQISRLNYYLVLIKSSIF